jgi:outer membrane protein TolC
MKRCTRLAILLALLNSTLNSATVFAQAAPEKSHNFLAQLLEAAHNSPAVQADQLRLEAATQSWNAAQLPFGGSISGGYAFSGNPNTTGPAANVGLNFDLNSDRLISPRRTLEEARRTLRRSDFQAKRTALNFWHSLRKEQTNLETAQIALELTEKQDQLAALRLEAGAMTPLERERSQLAVLESKMALEQAKLRLSGVRLQMQLALNISTISSENLVFTRVTLPLPSEKSGALETQLDQRIDQRIEVVQAQNTLNDAQTQLEKSRRELFPTLNLEGSWTGTAGNASASLNSNFSGRLGYSIPTSSTPSSSYSISLGASLSLNPNTWAQISALEAGIPLARIALETARKAVTLDLENKRQVAQLAQSALELSRRQLVLSQMQFEGIQIRAKHGSLSELDLLRAQLELRRAQDSVFAFENSLDSATLEWYEALTLPFPEIP